ncbi:MAG: homocitrate synthase/isopropylmalate synthase family protein [Candidatus Helarchaeota archaeon]
MKKSHALPSNDFLFDYNQADDLPKLNVPKEVIIWDETLRDGEQTPGVALSLEEKIEIAHALDDIGVGVIAIGFPAVSIEEKEIVKKIASEDFNAKLAAPARAVLNDVNHSIDCDVEEIPIFFPVSRLALQKVVKKTPEEAVSRVQKAIEHAKDHGVVPDFVAMDASRTHYNLLMQFLEGAVDAGANKLIIADTVGCLRPDSMHNLITKIKNEKSLKSAVISVHCHNDFGLSTANTLAAVAAGANYPHVCINGYGERSGNCPLEELVLSLEYLYAVNTNIRIEKIYELSTLTEAYFGLPLSVHKAIVGVNSFSHESGLHVNAIIEGGSETIEPFAPSVVGRKRRYFLGKFSGRSNIEYVMKLLNIDVSDEEIDKILQEIKKPIHVSRKQARETMKIIKEKIFETYSGIPAIEYLRLIHKITHKKPSLDLDKLSKYSVIF